VCLTPGLVVVVVVVVVPQVCDGGDAEGSHRGPARPVPPARRGARRLRQRALPARVRPPRLTGSSFHTLGFFCVVYGKK